MPVNSEPLNVFKTLNLSISQDLTIDSKRFLATIIFFSLKFSRSLISINTYSILLLKAKALFAGIVHGVVVQIIILESFKKSFELSLTLNATNMVLDVWSLYSTSASAKAVFSTVDQNTGLNP